MGLLLWALVSFILILFPFLGPALIPNFEMSGMTQVIMLVVGIISMVGLAMVVTITKLYRKTKANEALVRTGMGGMKVVLDGGCLVIPVIHQVVPVSLQSMRLDVVRNEREALICKDNLRANLSAEFYIKVMAEEEQVINASRSLGDRATNAEAIKELVMEKLINALRDVAAKSDLHELHADRDKFASEVKESVERDLAHNGLTLESVTISQLDQTNMENLDKNNVFNAQGLRRAAAIIQKNLVETNEIERAAQLDIEKKDVETDKSLYTQDLDRQKAKAEQEKDIRLAKAEAERTAREFELAQNEGVAKREIAKNQAVELEQVGKEQKIETANRDKETAIIEAEKKREVADKQREKAVLLAEVEKEKETEIARRAQQIAIAAEEEKRAQAEAKRLQAEKEKETADQEVKTVIEVEKANREKQKAVIDAQATAETAYVAKQRDADAQAYELKTLADGKKAAAEADKEAKVKAAEAEKESQVKQAEGQKAIAMVPVEVAAKQVAIDRDRAMIDVDVATKQVEVNRSQVEVDAKALEQKEKFGKAGIDLQIKLAEIEASREVQIARADAMAKITTGAHMTIYGDPNTLANMQSNFSQAMEAAQNVGGFLSGLPENSLAKSMVTGGFDALLNLINAGASRLQKDQGIDEEKAKTFVMSIIQQMGLKEAQKIFSLKEDGKDTPPETSMNKED